MIQAKTKGTFDFSGFLLARSPKAPVNITRNFVNIVHTIAIISITANTTLKFCTSEPETSLIEKSLFTLKSVPL